MSYKNPDKLKKKKKADIKRPEIDTKKVIVKKPKQ